MAVKARDYYEVLGVPRTATSEEIKRAYRQAARKHHPDLQPASERAKAAERFKEINEAQEVLTDPDKRARYDALGANWKGGEQVEDAGDAGDLFESFFGRRGGRDVRFTMPGADVEAEMSVSFDDLRHGGRRRLTLGEGRSIEVDIPVGVREGTTLRVAGKGEPGINGGPPGDLYLRLRLIPHPGFRVAGDDIETDLSLWPWQAVLGGEVRVDTPEGAVTLKVPPGTQNGRRLRLRGRGLPRAGGARGDLYAVARIVVPEHPTPAERTAYEALRQAASARADQPASV